jgi:hypothetical protein
MLAIIGRSVLAALSPQQGQGHRPPLVAFLDVPSLGTWKATGRNHRASDTEAIAEPGARLWPCRDAGARLSHFLQN